MYQVKRTKSRCLSVHSVCPTNNDQKITVHVSWYHNNDNQSIFVGVIKIIYCYPDFSVNISTFQNKRNCYLLFSTQMLSCFEILHVHCLMWPVVVRDMSWQGILSLPKHVVTSDLWLPSATVTQDMWSPVTQFPQDLVTYDMVNPTEEATLTGVIVYGITFSKPAKLWKQYNNHHHHLINSVHQVVKPRTLQLDSMFLFKDAVISFFKFHVRFLIHVIIWPLSRETEITQFKSIKYCWYNVWYNAQQTTDQT